MNNIVKECQKIARKQGEDSASLMGYSNVISLSVREFSVQIAKILEKMKVSVADRGSGIAMTMAYGFEQIGENSHTELQAVIQESHKQKEKEDEYRLSFMELKKRYPNLKQDIVEKTLNNTEQDKFMLFAIIIASLLAEGVVGSFLLGEVFAGGVFSALGFALGISLINVGGLGIVVGAFFDHHHRKKHIHFYWFILWVMVVIGLNVGIAYFRYKQVSEFEQGGDIDPVLAMCLFAILGIIFACIAFWKTFKRWEPEFILHAQWSVLKKQEHSFTSDIKNIFAQYRNEADSIHERIRQFFNELGLIIMEVNGYWTQTEVDYSLVSPIIATEFINGYNAQRVKNISVDDLPKDIPIPSWEDITKQYTAREEAKKILDEWNGGQMKSFVQSYSKLMQQLSHDKQLAKTQVDQNLKRYVKQE